MDRRLPEHQIIGRVIFLERPKLDFEYLKWRGLASLLIWLVLNTTPLHGQLPSSFQKVELLTGLTNVVNMDFAPDGRVFILDRYGEVLVYKPDVQLSSSAGMLPVFHQLEDGLLGLAFDPNFLTNNYVYLYYSPLSTSVNRVSRFTMNGDQMDIQSEVVVLEWATQRTSCCHSGGDLDFDSQGNLYIATGDNTDHGNFAPLNESDENKSAENTSSNTNDLRGKILRITPQSDGSYTIPSGNLFPGGVGGLPEVYVMGARNPFRIFVDKQQTDWLFWGEVGPDANQASNRGPEGLDELNLTKSAGNYGWPYFSGNNQAYLNNYASPKFYYDPSAPVNISVWNTGATTLPAARPSWLDFFHQSYLTGPRYYFDPAQTDQQRMPIEFDQSLFYYDFNTSQVWVVAMDGNGNILSNEQLAPSVFPVTSDGFIDLEMGPDGHLYILEYGKGCCSGNTGSGKLIRVDYTGILSNSSPIVELTATPTNGSLPLIVNFASSGTNDPDGDPLLYEWDFDSDGTIDSNSANPSHTYTTAGTFNAQLRVSDGNGGLSVKNVTISAGNNGATFTFNGLPDGGLISWNDEISFDLLVADVEDGSTPGGISCSAINVVPSFGHLNHFHDGLTLNACQGTIPLDTDHEVHGEDDIFFVLGVSYTDNGGLTSFDQLLLHPKRKEAEFYDRQSDVTTISNTDPWGGGSGAIHVNDESYMVLEGRNLVNITGVKYRVAAAAIGGTIELRVGSPSGPLLSSTAVPVTGSWDSWVDVESVLTDPGGKNDLYFVFTNNPGEQHLFDLNYVEFVGSGASIDNTPAEVASVTAASSTSVLVAFSEVVAETTAETISNYTIDQGISLSSAVLQPDKRTVLLTSSTLVSGITYNLTISNVENLAGLPIIGSSHPFIFIDPIRINSGGGQVTVSSGSYQADQFANGGAASSTGLPIAGTSDEAIYQSNRFGAHTYEIPVALAGPYDIRVHFAELHYGVNVPGTFGDRMFNVSIEGTPVLTNFDILSETSPATALIKEFDNLSVNDGFASIALTSVVGEPKISAIEILDSKTFNATPSITIATPINGTTVNQTFDVSFSVSNYEISPGGNHVHKFVDGAFVGMHYDSSPITINASPGDHTIKLELYDGNHSGTGVYDQVSLTVLEPALCSTSTFPDQWEVHDLETVNLAHRSVYILPKEDLDGDGFKDIAAGAWWYQNPGTASGTWVRHTVGTLFNNVALVYDFDGDGDKDLFGTQGTYESPDLVWAENDGSGNFTVHSNLPSGTSSYGEIFIAGIAGGIYQSGGPYQMAITWNGGENGSSQVQMVTVPSDPVIGTWSIENIHPNSLGEGLSNGDIDGDGDLDLFQAGTWLRNDGGSWTEFSTGITLASLFDRNVLTDIDRDGDLDGVVGQIGTDKEVAWFEAPLDPTQPWTKNTIEASVNGGLSIDVADMDFDGDDDVILGEWKDQHILYGFENDLCNSGTWIKHIIDPGSNKDHHDGAQIVDIDNDGDLDIVSIGWTKLIPRIFENKSGPPSNQSPIANAGQDQELTLPTSSVTLNGSGTDPDGGAIVSYAWTQQSGPNTASLTNQNTASLTAGNLVAGTYIFRLTVTDDESQTGFAEVTVTVTEQAGSQPPTADAGPDQGVTLPTNSITLSGTGNDPDGGTVTYSWTQESGPGTATLSGETTASLTADGLTAGSYVFRLTVTDDENEIGFDETNVVVSHPALIRINAGGPVVNFGGGTWEVDQYFSGGSNQIKTLGIAGTENDQIYQSDRNGNFTYEIPVPAEGVYSVNLHFAEIDKNKAIGQRVFNVDVENGQGQLTNYDILATTGATFTAVVETIQNINVADGNLSISFSSVIHRAKISAIDVLTSGGSINLPPVVTNPGDQLYNEGALVSLQIDATDPNPSDTLSYSASGLPAPLAIDPQTGLITGTLQAPAGSYMITITVMDQDGLTDADSFNISIGNVAPVLTSIGDQILVQGDSIVLNIFAADPNGEIPSLSGIGLPSFATVTDNNNGTGTITMAPKSEDVGSYPVIIAATDSQSLFDHDSITITVQSGSPTAVLRINAGGPVVNFGGDTWEVDQYFSSGGNQTKTNPIAGTENDQLYQTDRNGNFSYEIPVPSTGVYSVKLHFAEIDKNQAIGGRIFDIVIEDGQGQLTNYDIMAVAGATFTTVVESINNINVTDGFLNINFSSVVHRAKISAIEILTSGGSINLPPVVTNPGDQLYDEGAMVSLQIDATDPNLTDTLAFSAIGLPASLAIDTQTGLISGTLQAPSGDYMTIISVMDQDGLFDTDSFNIGVGNVAPVLTPIGDQFANSGESIVVNLMATDPNGEIPTLSGMGLPAFATITDNGNGSGQLTMVPQTGDVGSYPSIIVATDGDGLFDHDSITIMVTDGNQSAFLRINSGGPLVSFEGDIWQIDQFFSGGGNQHKIRPIAGTENDQIYQTDRNGNFSYEIPVASAGIYSVNLHFAEIDKNQTAGSRVFNVDIENGQGILANYDIVSVAGATFTAVSETIHNIEITDGNLSIDFSGVVHRAKISAIDILTVGGLTNARVTGPNVFATFVDNHDGIGSNLSVYPNPVSDRFKLAISSQVDDYVSIYLADQLGRHINLGDHKLKRGRSVIEFDLTNKVLHSGVYYLTVKSQQLRPSIFKLVITK